MLARRQVASEDEPPSRSDGEPAPLPERAGMLLGALAAATSTWEVAELLVREAVTIVGARWAGVARALPDGAVLEPLASAGRPVDEDDLPVRVPLDSNHAAALAARLATMVPLEAGAAPAPFGGVAAPLSACPRPAVLTVLFDLAPPERIHTELRQFCAIGTLAFERAAALERAETARVEAEAARRRHALLARAGELLSSSLAPGETWDRLTRLLVPGLADWCTLDLLVGDELVRMACAHREPALEPVVRATGERLRRGPDLPGIVQVLASGRPRFRPELTDDDLDAFAADAEYQRLVRLLAPRSGIAVPVRARGETLGVLTVVMSGSGRRFDEADLALALEVSGLAALAVSNARLVEAGQRARSLAERLQALTAELAAATTARHIARVIVEQGAKGLGASWGLLQPLDDAGLPLAPVAATGLPDEAADPGKSPAFPDTYTRSSERVVALPLALETRILGRLAFGFDGPRTLADEDRPFALALARQGALALERARLLEAERRSRDAAEEGRRRLDAVLAQLPAGVVVAEAPSGRIVLGNAQVEQLLGAGSPLASSVDGDASGTLRCLRPDGREYGATEVPLARSLLHGETVAAEELELVRRDGSRITVRVGSAPIRDEAGAVVAAVGTFFDVTESSRVAQALRASEERYRQVARVTNDVIWDLDVATGRVEWSGGIRTVFGYAEGVTRGPDGRGETFWRDAIHEADRERVVLGLREATDHGSDSWSDQYRFRRGDGTFAVVHDRCLLVRDAAGRVTRLVGAMLDVTDRARREEERNRLLEELGQAVRLRDDFLLVAGHELRTPISVLSLQLTSIRREGTLSARGTEKLERSVRQIDRLTRLVNELLDVPRLIGGRLTLQPEELELTALVREVASRSAASLDRSGVALTIEAPALVTGRWDRLRLDQVVTNLVANAVRYGDEKPVEIGVFGDGRQARVTVRDHGIGIAPADQARIFERFERAVSSRNYGGLGLGLWIVRQIVERHGGTIAVASAPGAGSTFTVTLPLVAPDAAPAG